MKGFTVMAKSANQSVAFCTSATPFSLAKLMACSHLFSHARISFGALRKGARVTLYFSLASCLCFASLTPTCSMRLAYHCLMFSVGLQAVLTKCWEVVLSTQSL